MLTSRFEIDVTPGGIPPVVNASQYDAGSRTIEFTLVSGTGDFVPPSGVKAEVRGTKPDGNGFSYEARILGRVVTVVITEQMTAANQRSGSLSTSSTALMKSSLPPTGLIRRRKPFSG